MPKKPCEEAALHLLLGVANGEVPVGDHDLSNVQLIVTFPPFANVTRAEGDAGEGYDLVPPPSSEWPGLTPSAVMLFVNALLMTVTIQKSIRVKLWADALRDAHKGIEPSPPAEALAELEKFQAALPPLPVSEPGKKKTPSKRTGTKEIDIQIRRLPKAG
jgi:hypothetical protein